MSKIAAAFLIAGAALWYSASGSGAPAIYFRFAKIDRGDVTDAVTATGTLNAVTTVQVGSQVSGRIAKLYCDFNANVKKDQVLALIDPAPFQAQLEQAQAAVVKAQAATMKASASIDVTRANFKVAEAEVGNVTANVKKAQVTLLLAQRGYDRIRTLAMRDLISKQDADTSEADVGKARADLAALEAQLNSAIAKASAARSVIAQTQTDVASNLGDVAQAAASLSLAKTNLEFCKIVSPINGIVISRNVDMGQTVAASFQAPVLFLIADDLAMMQITANVDEADVGRVKDRQDVTFTVDAFPDRQFEGKVSQVRLAPIVAQNVVTYHVIVDVANKDLVLMPGMTTNASILVARRKGVLRVPNAALAFNPAVVKPDGSAGPGNRPPDAKATATKPKPPGEKIEGPDAEGHRPGRVFPAKGLAVDKPLKIKIGVTDGAFTEVVSGDLKEGDSLAIGITREAPASAQSGILNAIRPRGGGGGGGPRI